MPDTTMIAYEDENGYHEEEAIKLPDTFGLLRYVIIATGNVITDIIADEL